MKLKLPRFTIQVTASYEREILRKPINRVKFFIGTGFFIFVLFFIFGVRPVAINSAENTKLLQELEEIRTNMRTKLGQINEGELSLTELEENLEYMNTLLPNESAVQNYLEDFVILAAKNGYFVKRFTKPSGANSESVPLEIEIVGKLENLPELVAAIENSRRITNINEVFINSIEEDRNYSIRFKMEIYTLK